MIGRKNMKISGKIHRGASIAAGVVMLIFLLVGTGTNILSTINLSKHYETMQLLKTILNLAVSAIATLLLIVVLFRGRKDSVSGVLVILTILPILVTGVAGCVSRIITGFGMLGTLNKGFTICMMIAGVIQLAANLVGVGFRALIATECFKPGKISGGSTKSFLVILPIVNVLLVAVAGIVQQLYVIGEYGFAQFLTIALIPAVLTVFTSIGTVIMGLAFSIPVYEKDFLGYM